MVYAKQLVNCPVCGKPSRVVRKWTRNKYGVRYEYFVYYHAGQPHYVNKNEPKRSRLRKGELETALMEMINSQDFKLGSFTVNDIMNLTSSKFSGIGYCAVKMNLDKLCEIGMIESRKEGRNIYYVNTVAKERLSFIILSLSITLEDIGNDGMFKKHIAILKIKNNQSWPLYYIPLRAVGDIDSKFDQLQLRVSDPESSMEYPIVLIEDNPMDKRILAKLPHPLLPLDSKILKLEYLWDEPKKSYVHSSATEMESFQFILASNSGIKITAIETSIKNDLFADLSGSVLNCSDERWRYIKKISLKNVEPFSMFQFKWQFT
ncbi:MAG: hypothetical protein QXN66_06480 [Thermoplasmatales archaeon]